MEKGLQQSLQNKLYFQKAVLYAKENQLSYALDNINKALEAEYIPEYILVKAKILAQMGRFEEAIPLFGQINPDSPFYTEANAAKAKAIKLKDKPFKWLSLPQQGNAAIIRVLALVFLISTIIISTLYISRARNFKLKDDVIRLSEQTAQISNKIMDLNGALILFQDSMEYQINAYHNQVKEIRSVLEKLNAGINTNQNANSSEFDAINKDLESVSKKLEDILTNFKNLETGKR